MGRPEELEEHNQAFAIVCYSVDQLQSTQVDPVIDMSDSGTSHGLEGRRQRGIRFNGPAPGPRLLENQLCVQILTPVRLNLWEKKLVSPSHFAQASCD